MQELGRINVYQNLLDNETVRISDYIRRLTLFNRMILQNIEPIFLQEDYVGDKDARFSEALNFIIDQAYYEGTMEEWKDFRDFLEKLVQIRDNQKKAASMFNRLIKSLSEYNNRIIDSMAERRQYIFETTIWNYERDRYRDFLQEHFMKNHRVFLSYAFKDKLYTLALFFYFQRYDIFLYIDWMNRGKAKDGIALKADLHAALINSESLIYLRTPNSELKISGRNYIRPWCSWEMGHFYDIRGQKEKYYIDLYRHDNVYNQQLAGVKVLRSVGMGSLYGEL